MQKLVQKLSRRHHSLTKILEPVCENPGAKLNAAAKRKGVRLLAEMDSLLRQLSQAMAVSSGSAFQKVTERLTLRGANTYSGETTVMCKT